MPKKVNNLIVDTSAFIKNVQLQELAENVFTVQEVVDEMKNNAQLKRLAVIPYNLQVKQPDPESLKVVSDFAKKTGDFATLSLTDLTVLALTYQFEKEKVGVDHLRSEPLIAKTVFSAHKPAEMKDQFAIAGFYNPGKSGQEEASTDDKQESSDEFEEIEEEIQEKREDSQDESGNESDETDSKDDESNQEAAINDEELIKKFGTLGFNTIPNEQADDILQPVKEEESEDDESGDEQADEEEDDDEGWITPGNISHVKKNFGAEVLEEKDVEVACITTDFAMQNVLKQMGLNVTSLDGRIIKHMRTFILRCYTCYKTTTDPTKVFCPKCGHKTLKRVAVSVNDNGEQMIHINARRNITAKYKNQPLPMPKGGKYACNPLLFEDQSLPQQRLPKKALIKTDALDENYTAGYSPFVMRDVDSRSSNLRNTANIKQWMSNYEYDNHRRAVKKNKKK